ncbi:hypothetical protein A2291_00455 [candidate division WOR-1 bacterium RIFOXYB2_FULL_42_35]|uniref:HhH-GPD domain-containing protein n=1 Tax=candidate division WOR-1 bacterium RIFOXYC2_FULL_41_25 TaxID=1802586 RepID=A0A1F4TP61_UNCSA|nr:MAG: hypothetical protein A2247_08020 [candidate division WOR-1 bacterium RIFOXYA2_FULL_41_14]OGC23704.1 MAG: hypothetical protein A2291_00455 [candidate division WOR-1 bacterium RIFOXYB2_FULL_42_35]OGC34417.1 MAG: hypothetical protein A2462_01220 [candidate division WOR-1 bacterium RIFOXYC2_FULL_41_25]OGC43267.1 MAG: hypothetical protein A2548_01565 [candidate division WOR-1 bacterium RIFOXYD2_FULL_41_8]
MKKPLPHTIYKTLLKTFGPQRWWPAETPFEVIVGAILTQSTNWTNVEKAIRNLKRQKLLTLREMSKVKSVKLQKAIRPSGYFRAKAKKLKAFVGHLQQQHKEKLKSLFDQPISQLRVELLSIHGIGPETADSIILYAANKPSFVVDAYTKRIGQRVGLFEFTKYDQIQRFFEDNLPKRLKIYNEFHALIVKLGKDYCQPKPRCENCPLKVNNLCSSPAGQQASF